MNTDDLPWRNVKTRGLTIVQFKKYLEEKFGKAETEKVISTLPPHAAQTIRAVKKGEGYPFEIQRLLRLAIITRIDSDDPLGVMYRMGLVTASWDFSILFKPLFSFVSAKTIFNRVETLWKKYYDHGEMKLVELSATHAILELTDFPCDPYFPPIITSWMQVALQVMKKDNPRVEHTHTSDREQFNLTWD